MSAGPVVTSPVLRQSTSGGSLCSSDSSSKTPPRIFVHPQTRDPHRVWTEFKKRGRICNKVRPLKLSTPVRDDHIRFVCISDTHDLMGEVLDQIPPGDVLIHAGDFTDMGRADKVYDFNQQLGRLPHKYKIVIAGNHEVGFDSSIEDMLASTRINEMKSLRAYGVQRPQDLLTNCIYLQDSEIKIYGVKIYGTPWNVCEGWAFYRERGAKLLEKWQRIPEDTDVLVTHSPPLGHGDLADWDVCKGLLGGCVELLNVVEKRVKPLFHVFGHVHTRHGQTTNGVTQFINASICDRHHKASQPPIIFDIPIMPSHASTSGTKEEKEDVLRRKMTLVMPKMRELRRSPLATRRRPRNMRFMRRYYTQLNAAMARERPGIKLMHPDEILAKVVELPVDEIRALAAPVECELIVISSDEEAEQVSDRSTPPNPSSSDSLVVEEAEGEPEVVLPSDIASVLGKSIDMSISPRSSVAVGDHNYVASTSGEGAHPPSASSGERRSMSAPIADEEEEDAPVAVSPEPADPDDQGDESSDGEMTAISEDELDASIAADGEKLTKRRASSTGDTIRRRLSSTERVDDRPRLVLSSGARPSLRAATVSALETARTASNLPCKRQAVTEQLPVGEVDPNPTVRFEVSDEVTTEALNDPAMPLAITIQPSAERRPTVTTVERRTPTTGGRTLTGRSTIPQLPSDEPIPTTKTPTKRRANTPQGPPRKRTARAQVDEGEEEEGDEIGTLSDSSSSDEEASDVEEDKANEVATSDTATTPSDDDTEDDAPFVAPSTPGLPLTDAHIDHMYKHLRSGTSIPVDICQTPKTRKSKARPAMMPEAWKECQRVAWRTEANRQQRVGMNYSKKIYYVTAKKGAEVEDVRELQLDRVKLKGRGKYQSITVDPRLTKWLKYHQAEGILHMYACVVERQCRLPVLPAVVHARSTEATPVGVEESEGSDEKEDEMATMGNLEEDTWHGGILTHEMGLGKTLQVITLMYTLLTDIYLKNHFRRMLILCPLGVVDTWRDECAKWLRLVDFDLSTVHALASTDNTATHNEAMQRWSVDGGIMIMPYTKFTAFLRPRARGDGITAEMRKRMETMKSTVLRADLLVMDEAHLLKSAKGKVRSCIESVSTHRRICVTGTPFQNALPEYFRMIELVRPGILGDETEFTQTFVDPVNAGTYIQSTAGEQELMQRRSAIMHRQLTGKTKGKPEGIVHRRTWDELKKTNKDKMGDKHDHVLWIRMSRRQEIVYMALLKMFADRATAPKKGKGKRQCFMDAMAQADKVLVHPFCLTQGARKTSVIATTNDATDRARRTATPQLADGYGIDDRDDVTEGNNGMRDEATVRRLLGMAVGDVGVDCDALLDETEYEMSAKLCVIKAILDDAAAKGDRTLLFARTIVKLDMVEKMLAQCGMVKGVDYARIDGSVKQHQRTGIISMFETEQSKARLLIMTTTAGGVGISLPSANRVIMIDVSWNPADDQQAVARAYRYGQTKPVHIYRLVTRGTHEERRYLFSVRKESVARRVVDDHSINNYLDKDQRAAMYTYDYERDLALGNDVDGSPIYKTEASADDDLMIALLADMPDGRNLLAGYHKHGDLVSNYSETEVSAEDRETAHSAWGDVMQEKGGEAAHATTIDTSDTAKTVKCPHCPFVGKRLSKHTKMHNPKSGFPCRWGCMNYYCGSEGGLVRHHRSTHRNTKR